uniref:Uncharacterized protein n=1 Tax=Arion vulgaris TaxID=1028688 RepID=A0A0B6ZEK5_9EUPU
MRLKIDICNNKNDYKMGRIYEKGRNQRHACSTKSVNNTKKEMMEILCACSK